MHVLIAPDSFSGTLTATQAAEAMATGWRRSAPDDLLSLAPLSDGGPGFLDVLTAGVVGESVVVTATGPRGTPVPGALLITGEGGRRTAWVESAQAIGLHLLDAGERDPGVTSSWGLGELLAAALAEDVERIVVGLGGSGTNDAGAGMLAALGAGPRDVLGGGGGGLIATREEDLGGLAEVRERFAGVELVAATDVASPLLGLKGASAVFAREKGATPEQAQLLEGNLGHFVDVVRRVAPAPLDLLRSESRRLEREAGAGAAGGAGYGLLLLGATRRSGVEVVMEALDLPGLTAAADVVITGEGNLGQDSLQGEVVAGVAALAAEHATPAVALAGQVTISRRQAMMLGLSGTYAVVDRHRDPTAAMADPVGTLADRAARVAATWSPRR